MTYTLTYTQVQKTTTAEGKTCIYIRISTSLFWKSRAVCFDILKCLSSQQNNRKFCRIECSKCEGSKREYFISRISKKSQFMTLIQRVKVRQDQITSSDFPYHTILHLRYLFGSCHLTQKKKFVKLHIL